MSIQGGIDAARNNLTVVSNNYAEIQKQLDRYNKVFDTYSKASPETQLRAASVMRQALDEYNSLKKQQEENALKIYEAQSWVDYYTKNTQNISMERQATIPSKISNTPINVTSTEMLSTSNIATPGVLDNDITTVETEPNAIDTNTTVNTQAPVVATTNQNYTNSNIPIGVRNYVNSMTPKYQNTTISQANTSNTNNNINWSNYGPGSIATFNNTGGTVGLNTSTINTRRDGNKIVPMIKRTISNVYNYLFK